MSCQTLYNFQKSSLQLDPYGQVPISSNYVSSTMTIAGRSFKTLYKLPKSSAIPPRSSTPKFEDPDMEHIPFQLPSPVSDDTPRQWKEWETNANWPFPAKSKMQSKPQTPRTPAKAELEVNRNWPFPAGVTPAPQPSKNSHWPHPAPSNSMITPAPLSQVEPAPTSRRRSISQSSTRAPTYQIYAPAVSREPSRAQADANASWNYSRQQQLEQQQQHQQQQQENELRQRHQEEQRQSKRRSGILKRSDRDRPVVPPLPPQTQAQPHADRPLRFPSASTAQARVPDHASVPAAALAAARPTILSPSLASGPQLIQWDLRLPYTYTRKVVRERYPTHLNRQDLDEPATNPPRSRVRIYIPQLGVPEWTVTVDARRRSGSSSAMYVSVEDVLRAVAEMLERPVSTTRWARDSIDPSKRDRVSSAFGQRVDRLRSLRRVGAAGADPEQQGVLRIDYLGAYYIFRGLSVQYGQDKAEWLQLDVMQERRR